MSPSTSGAPSGHGRPGGQWYPREWPERIRALAAGELTPVTPRLAATVLLLRDGPHGPSVHLLRRRTSMAFAAGAYAFPGGSVDPRDELGGEQGGAAGEESGDGPDGELRGRRPDFGAHWAGPPPAAWAERFGTGEATARAVVCAAVRETFEESGVLLAGPDARTVVADTTGDDWERDREALVAHELSFADLLRRRQLVLRSDLLGGWARWITPEFESRRYDTWFFVAALPPGQRTRNASTEAESTVWLRPEEAVAGYDDGELLMMPPTIATLRQLCGYGSAAEVLEASAARDLSPVLARATLDGDEVVLSWPGHDEFTRRVAGSVPGDGGRAGTAAGTADETADGPQDDREDERT